MLDVRWRRHPPQVSFTPDSAILAAAIGQINGTGKVVLWDTTTWHRRATLILPYSPAGLAFVNGGARFVTPSILPASAGSTSGTPRRSNRSASPSPSRPPTVSSPSPTRGHEDRVRLLQRYHPRARRRPASWQRTACRLAGRNLTRTEWAQYLPGQAYRKTCPQWPAGR